MTTRRHYLISYDISIDDAGDKRRNKVFEALTARGDRAQFSVFFCQLNPSELAELRDQLIHIIHHKLDQILIVDLGPAHNPLDHDLEYLGKPFQVSTRVIVV
jgi:CRISPR-associated protein Cas2